MTVATSELNSFNIHMHSVSVIIPTCDRPELLAKCLVGLRASLDALAIIPVEVIVTDDGKLHPAKHLIDNEFPWARWSEGPYRGPAANRNAGAQEASNEWLAFIDDDCIPDVAWLRSFAERVDPNDVVLEGRTTCRSPIKSLLEFSPINETGGYLWSCNLAIKRSFFEHLGGFDENFPNPHMEDVDLRERILGQHVPIHFVETAIVDHPPRKAVLGKRRAMMSESSFYFYSKLRRSKGFSLINIRLIVMGHVHCLIANRRKANKLAYIGNAIVETFCVAAFSPTWSRTYKALNDDTGPDVTYPTDIDDRLFFRSPFTRSR